MSILQGLINSWSNNFESTKYPLDFYFSHVNAIPKSASSRALSSLIENMLCWKDGKVKKDPSGLIRVRGVLYSKALPKPNTYDSIKHSPIYQSLDFYNWAKDVMKLTSFNSEIILEITAKFKIWSNNSIVLPSFLSHILNPKTFPIYDQHVERARRFFSNIPLNSDSTLLDINSYKEYHAFWFELLSDLGVKNIITAPIENIKKVDNALWTIGKYLKKSS